METKANYALIGAFTVAGFLGILGFLMWFAKLELDRQFEYYDVFFPEVAGLSVSSQVQYAGLNVGRVVSTVLAEDDQPGAVRVRLELNTDTPVRVDSRASIDTSAVTGVSIVTISSGSSRAALLRDITQEGVPVIPSSPSTLQTLGEQAPELLSRLNVLTERVTQLVNDQNMERVSNILQNVENASAKLDQTMSDVSEATGAITRAADNLSTFSGKLDPLATTAETTLVKLSDASTSATTLFARAEGYIDGDLGPLTTELNKQVAILGPDLDRLSQRVEASLGKLDSTMDSATGALDSAKGAIDEVGPVFSDLRKTLGNLNNALSNLPEELPRIVANIGDAAEAAASAFESLQGVIGDAREPLRVFSRDGLPQYSRLGQELREMVTNINGLVSTLRRNPSQLLRGQPTPEFRR